MESDELQQLHSLSDIEKVSFLMRLLEERDEEIQRLRKEVNEKSDAIRQFKTYIG